MKKVIIFSTALLFVCTVFASVYPVDAKLKDANEIVKKADVTGDRVQNEVILKQNKKLRERKFVLTANLSNGKTHIINLEKGFEQKLNLVDVDHDGIKDVFVRVSNKEKINHYLYSFKDFVVKELPIPELPAIQGQFIDGYRAKIGIQETNMEYTFKLNTRKRKYDSLGIYQNGKINEPIELVINPYDGFKTMKINDGENGLKGVQMISGIEKDDMIALVESYYSLVNGNWNLKKVMVLEVNGKESGKNPKN